ncbi:MAG: PEGA domain-containing protein [Acidobacteria bacterium]|nr:PEGA domain-containing protein [Acidobacteriota bacterium]MCI0717588.1 PEGA domain-containing protein [Acidobacteriota bacterium]
MPTSLISVLLVMQLGFGLEDGTPIKMRITRTLSSADAKVDDRVDFEVLEEIKVGDVVVVSRGALALATVTEAQPKRRMGRAGKLNVNIDTVRLVSGEKIPLRAVKEVKGGGNQGKMTGAIVATSIVFFPAAPLFLFVHGKDITIPKGTEITAYINGNTPLDPSKFGAKPVVVTAPVAPGPAPTSTPTPILAATSGEGSTIDVTSAPEGADITIGGKFVGSTPSNMKLAPGEHTIYIEKSGFKRWQRTMTVSSSGKLSVNAALEPSSAEASPPPVNASPSPALPVPGPSTPNSTRAYANCGESLNSVPVSSSSTGLKSLACGEEVMVLSRDRNWTRVRSTEGKEGSVPSGFISETQPQRR